MKRIAVLDDYEGVARQIVDWSRVDRRAEVVFFDQPIGDLDRLVNQLAEFDAVALMRERTPFPAALIERLPRLKFIVFTGGRNSSLDIAAATAKQIPVSYTEGGGTIPTCELTWALALGCAKRIVAGHEALLAGRWRGFPLPEQLEGERFGIVGLGKIGSRVALVAQAFGMEVIAWSENLTGGRASAAGVRAVGKDELFSTSKIVSLHLVLSERTRHVVGRSEIARMRKDAILVNTSRAGLIDMPALIAALKENRIGGAGLDVYPIEPLPAGDPLIGLSNVVLAPHLGYVTRPVFETFYRGVVEALAGWLDGAPVRLVNPEALRDSPVA